MPPPAKNPNQFLNDCKAIIHVGANEGQERELYSHHSLDVLWVEALPEAFQRLTENLREYPRQLAINALVTDEEDKMVEFHVSNNDGKSSSIYDLHEHKELWPEVNYTKTIQLHSTTLATLLRDAGRSPSEFDALILDVQGAELLVVRGAGEVIDSLRYIKAEASDFESYKGACTMKTLTQALKKQGFTVRSKTRFAEKKGIGSYYDVLYERIG